MADWSSAKRKVPPLLYQEHHWYACYTRGRHEKAVAAALAREGIRHFLPTRTEERVWSDRRKSITVPLFPSYVFAKFALVNWPRVVRLRGVVTLVENRGCPLPVSSTEIENVRRLVEVAQAEGVEPAAEPLAEGEQVTVSDGPFKGLTGVIVQKRGKTRLLVELSVVGRAVSVEIQRPQVTRLVDYCSPVCSGRRRPRPSVIPGPVCRSPPAT